MKEEVIAEVWEDVNKEGAIKENGSKGGSKEVMKKEVITEVEVRK